jgi:hypothetical protein
MKLQPTRENAPRSQCLALLLTVVVMGCSGGTTEPSDEGSSGSVGSEVGGSSGPNAKGGGQSAGRSGTNPPNTGSGGAVAIGGTYGAAGIAMTGGTFAIGGSLGQSSNSGGTVNAGATHSEGGVVTSTSSPGGSPATGGRNLGGSLATGGNTAIAGRAVGGNLATGGRNLGGSLATGGNTATAGSAVGGSLATGGSTFTGGGTTSAGSGSGGSPILAPESGALLGIYYGDASIAATASKLGKAVPLHLTYYAWQDDWTSGITAEDLRAGRIPFVNWELYGAAFDDIIAGKDDAMITQRAVAAGKLAKNLFLDFGAEMNGDWSPWSGAQNGKSSAKYIAAYRHVHDLFVNNGASNVIWAFCPNVTSVPDEAWNEPLDYYPGDSYVDWTCVDGYNWGTSSSGDSWQTFSQVFKDIYSVLATKNKPIIIGEMASTELGGDKAAWIAQIVPTLKSEFPLIKGLLWFDINKETDWRISSSAASEAAFKALANDPWFAR